NPNYVAGYLIGAIFVALALAVAAQTQAVRVAGYSSAILMFAAILGSRSRGAWVGLVAGWAIWHVVRTPVLWSSFRFRLGSFAFFALGWLLWTYGREVRNAAAHASGSARLWLSASAAGVTAILADSLFNFQFAIPPTFVLLFTLIALPGVLKPSGPQVTRAGN